MQNTQKNLTPEINQQSAETVRALVKQKMSGAPFTVSNGAVSKVITDMDCISAVYPRFWRGIPEFTSPVIFEREAGYRPLNSDCYKPFGWVERPPPPDSWFSPPCATVTPAYSNIYSQWEQR